MSGSKIRIISINNEVKMEAFGESPDKELSRFWNERTRVQTQAQAEIS